MDTLLVKPVLIIDRALSASAGAVLFVVGPLVSAVSTRRPQSDSPALAPIQVSSRRVP